MTNEQRWKVAQYDGVGAGEIVARVKPRLVMFAHGGSPESLPLIRQHYDGPVEIGEDMMTIDIGDRVTPLNCPHCPRRMRYLHDTDEGFPLYVCPVHGWFVIGADGRLSRMAEVPLRSH